MTYYIKDLGCFIKFLETSGITLTASQKGKRMKKDDGKKQNEQGVEMEKALYQLGFEESNKIDEREKMVVLLKNHLHDLGFEELYVNHLLSIFKQGFQKGNEKTKDLFIKKYLMS